MNIYDGGPHRLISFAGGHVVPATAANVAALEFATEQGMASGSDDEFHMKTWVLLDDENGLRMAVNLAQVAWWKIDEFTYLDGELLSAAALRRRVG